MRPRQPSNERTCFQEASDYHQATDEPRYINYDKSARLGRFVAEIMWTLADRPVKLLVLVVMMAACGPLPSAEPPHGPDDPVEPPPTAQPRPVTAPPAHRRQ